MTSKPGAAAIVTATNDDRPPIETRLSRLRAGLENRVPKLDAPFPAFTLVLSVSDGETRAVTAQGSATSLEAAWTEALAGLHRVMAKEKLRGRFLRLDWVENVETLTWKRLRKRLRDVKRNYCRRGIALDADFSRFFLEQELNASAMLYGGNAISHCVVNEKNFAIATRRKYGPESAVNFADDQTVYTFESGGLFCAEDGEVLELFGPGRDAGRRKITALNPDLLNRVIKDASDFLASQVRPDGRFVYGYHPCFDREIGAYNALRHASTIYSMLEAWEVTHEPGLLEAIERALDYLCKHLIRSDRENKAFVVDTGNEIKLGANATAILAMTKYMSLFGSGRFSDILEKLANGIVFMQGDDGSFVHVLNWPGLDMKERFRIVYYDGEAAFALMRLYGLTGQDCWIEAVEKAFDHFIRQDHWVHHDHWLSYCTNELTVHRPEERYFRFGIRNFEDHLDFVAQRITTFPTLLELMMASRRMLDRMHERPECAGLLKTVDESKFDQAMHFRAAYILNGHFWPEFAMYFQNPNRILGSFFIRHHAFRVRIDDVEHYLSGLVAYSEYMADR